MNRPYVIINCAMSADGKIASPSKKQLNISNEEDKKRMYNLRNECDAVLVGIGTVISDDPKLTVKEKYVKNPRNPLRIILDSYCKTKEDALVVNDKAKTLIFTNSECNKKYSKNVEVIKCDIESDGLIDIAKMLEVLYNLGIKKLLVEGGGTVIWNFLKKGFVDDLYVFISPIIIGGKSTPTIADGEGISNESEIINLDVLEISRLNNGILVHYKMIK